MAPRVGHLLMTGMAMAAGLAGAAAPQAAAPAANRYWELGWGNYGLGMQGTVEDAARFDWSLICFGNESASRKTVDWCNRILEANPRHKFLIRVWVTRDREEQLSFLHLFYKPGAREFLLGQVEEQVRLVVNGLTRPENVTGSVFLEEMPGHFSSFNNRAYARWKPGDPLPWDIARFEREIAAELGAPFDWTKREHRLWWGRKWAEAINTVHKTMKEASGGRLVFYYQATANYTLDHYDFSAARNPDVAAREPSATLVPIHYADIVKPGLCDGIFGYPNNKSIWEEQTLAVVRNLGCLLFSQVSLPPEMRLCTLDDMVALARWDYPGNLGSFLFPSIDGRKPPNSSAWNRPPYPHDRSWTIRDHVRRFGWDRKIGLDVVARRLPPRVDLDYSLKGLKPGGRFTLKAQVGNPRHPSWYGGNAEPAVFRRVRASLALPGGFSLESDETVELGELAADARREASWRVRLDKADPALPPGQGFRVRAEALGSEGEISGEAFAREEVKLFADTQREIDEMFRDLHNPGI